MSDQVSKDLHREFTLTERHLASVLGYPGPMATPPGQFTQGLFRLLFVADESNFAKLASVFQDEANAVDEYRHGSLGKRFREAAQWSEPSSAEHDG